MSDSLTASKTFTLRKKNFAQVIEPCWPWTIQKQIDGNNIQVVTLFVNILTRQRRVF